MTSDTELNESVALKLGWINDGERWIPPNGEPNYVASRLGCPKYSQYIEAAWEIIEHLKQFPNYWIAIRYKPISETENGGKYNFMIATNREGPLAESIANTAPRAICEAFLKLD